MSLRDTVDYTAVLLVLAGLLFCVPLVDMWQDVTAGGKSPLSTLLENSIVMALSGGFVWLSLWLSRNDWEREYSQLVARWSILGTGCVALAYGWVLGFQVVFQNDLKPYVIAGDGIIIGGLVLFIAGIYNARSKRESAARAVERDRFSALFDNTSDAMMAVESATDGAVIAAVNEPFQRAFGGRTVGFVGQPVVETVSEWLLAPEPAEQAAETPPSTRLETVIGEPDEQAELRAATADGPRDYLVTYVPVGAGPDQHDEATGFVMFTDITAQKKRERQFETVSRGAEGLLNARSVEGVVASTRTLIGELFDTLAVGVWEYEPESGAYRPIMLTVGEGDSRQIEGVPPVPAAEPGRASDEAVGPDGDGAGPEIDVDAVGEALSSAGIQTHSTSVRDLPGTHVLTVSRPGPELSDTERHLLDLLVANTRAAIHRVEREEALTRRNDQLEFVNSLLRHDIQNSMTIIRARGQALSESLSGQDAEYARTVVEQSDDVIDLIGQFRVLLDALTAVGAENTEPVSLSSVLEERVDTLETTYPDVTVETDIPEGVTVEADEMLGNVLGNVLDNAVEHNDRAEPSLEVSVTVRDDTTAVRVADDGPGVPDAEKETVFRRGNRGLKDADIGSGFGLFFVDTMLEKYGGQVAVTDNEPRGAVFTLSFQTAD
ncbi:sensor histidine kinase [Haloarcula brevis]|uniref:sensor histidine kinase n=1 Tax=Haloarcula brevis TaxID=3111453 RepID=UPI00300F73AB